MITTSTPPCVSIEFMVSVTLTKHKSFPISPLCGMSMTTKYITSSPLTRRDSFKNILISQMVDVAATIYIHGCIPGTVRFVEAVGNGEGMSLVPPSR